ncbi:Protein CBG28078 [Caenorhabditis briggsae]|uniref:Protein CBG28078 n=1 Tax=Caenorhabditis briggsae TaxID=6238 RepID=B6IGR8_CAEBR|nr:Protein CBG28078 [Caenorhabditis briggsae]CAR99098.1 Protein CBG28078 [Caenorhabditis briggsae]
MMPEAHMEFQLEASQQPNLVYDATGFCAMLAIVMVPKGLIEYKSRQASEDAEAGALLLEENDEDDN